MYLLNFRSCWPTGGYHIVNTSKYGVWQHRDYASDADLGTGEQYEACQS